MSSDDIQLYPAEECFNPVPAHLRMTATEVLQRQSPPVGNPATGHDLCDPLLALAESLARKTKPLATGCFDYFPDALAAVAQLSFYANDKHNPGEAVHDARSKSQDDADCLLRHFIDRGKQDTLTLANGMQVKVLHSTAMAWRALRILQKECEAAGAPLARGARL